MARIGNRDGNLAAWRASVLAGALLFTSSVHAGDAELRAHVSAILSSGLKAGPGALASAEQQFTSAQRGGVDAPQLHYAFSLAQLKNRRYDDAANTLSALVADRPDYLPAWQAKIWLAVLRKNYSAALVDAELVSRRFPPADATAGEEQQYHDLASFLGRTLAYLSGPVADTVAAARVKEVQRKLVARLTTTRRAAFEQAFADVTAQFEQLAAAKDETQTATQQQQQQQQELQREQLAAEKENVAQQQASVEQQAALALASAQSQLDRIDQQLAPLNAQFEQLSLQGRQLQEFIARLELEISQLLLEAEEVVDPALRAHLLLEADRVGLRANAARREYQVLDLQAVQINNQRAALAQQRQSAIAAYQAETKRLGVAAQRLDRTTQRIARDQREATKPATGFTGRVRALSSTATAWTTYQPFPFERERQRLLDELAGQ